MRENEIFVGRRLIGSRPPRCESRCRDCGHCKAVQVPISPQFRRSSSSQKQQTISSRRSQYLYAAAYSRGNDISNYKPMCWKCQCGDSFFNPWIMFFLIYIKKKKKVCWKKIKFLQMFILYHVIVLTPILVLCDILKVAFGICKNNINKINIA